MNKLDILSIHNIAEWAESEQLEFKLSTREHKEIVRTVNAFSNTRGGVVVVGVSDNGEIVGQDISDATIREVTQTILANVSERVYPSIFHATLEDKSVLVISVSASPLKPHTSYGRTFKRIGSSTIVVDPAEYQLLLSQKRNGGGADSEFVSDGNIDEISEEKVRDFIEVANTARGFNLNIHSPLEDILETLELIREGVITKGAFLLFGKNPQKRFPSAVLKCAFFSDKEMNQYLAQRIIGGTIFEQYEQALQFVGEYLPSVVDTSSGASTRMQWRFPLDVIRELLVNALVHRDYHAGVESYLSIVKDRGFEVYNPGLLPAPRITPDTIYRDHSSVPANRRIARAFFLSGLIEQWGKGASRAWNLCRTHGAPEPVWTSKDGMVWVRLFG